MMDFDAMPPSAPVPRGADPSWWAAVPYFGALAANPDVRILVEHFDDARACWSMLGYMPASGGDTTLLNLWPRPGRFKLTPVDADGHPVEEARAVLIDRDHTALKQGPVGGPATSTAIIGGVPIHGDPALVDRVLTGEQQRAREERERLDKREAELRELEQRIHAERNGAVGILEERVGASMGKVLEVQAEIAKKGTDEITDGFTKMMTLMQMQSQLQTEREERRSAAEAERLRREHEAALERARLDVERERLRMEREREEARQRAEAEDRRSREAMQMQQAFLERMMSTEGKSYERELSRTQEHSQAMLRLVEQKGDPLAQVTTLVTAGVSLAKTLGFDPADLKNLLGGAQQVAAGGGTLAALFDLAGKVLPPMLERMAVEGDEGDEEGDEDDRVPVPLPNGTVILLDPEEAAKLEAARQSTPALPGPVAGVNVPQTVAPGVQPIPAHVAGIQPGEVVFNPADLAGMPGVAPIPGVVPQAPVAPAEPPLPPGVTIEDVRRFRAALVAMVEEGAGVPDANLTLFLMQRIPAVPGLLDYLKAVTVVRALRDVAADDTTINRVIRACRAGGVHASILGEWP